jgi:hypothetical protein
LSRLPWIVLLLASATGGCALGPRPADSEQSEALAYALARAVRVHYDVLLARETGDRGPSQAELDEAQAALTRALEDAGAAEAVADGPRDPLLGGAALPVKLELSRARDVLIRHDYVFLPVPPGDPGVALARVSGREAGLHLELWGRRVSYRRVVHDGLLLPDYTTHRGLRLRVGGLPPAGRVAEPTVYLDREAIARRAGKGICAHLDAAELAREVELRQVIRMQLARDLVGIEDLLEAERGQAMVRVHLQDLVAVLRHGDVRLALGEIQALAVDPDAGARGQAAALLVAELGLEADPDPAQDLVRQRADELHVQLR